MNIRERIGTRLGMTIVVIGIVAVAVFGIAVVASIPDPNGVIHACYDVNKGNLRLVESAATCKVTEQAISWNQTGPQGPQGPQGPTGPQGPEGPAGSGTLGPSGSARETNPEGPHFYATCGNPNFVSVVELPVTLTNPSIIHAFGQILPQASTTFPIDMWSIARAELLSGSAIVASRDGGRVVLRGNPETTNSESVVSGPLLNGNDVYIVPPGSYVLRLTLTDTRTTHCGIQVISSGRALLSFQAFSAA